MYRQFIKQLLIKKRFLNRLSSTYNFEMPECYQKSFYLANAPLYDNVNWFFFRGVEVAFDKFVEKMKSLSVNFDDKNCLTEVQNRIGVLEPCTYVMEVNFPLILDSGKLEMIKGYCVKHGIHHPVHLGGLRISENIDKAQLKAIAALSSYKHMCVDVPFAGSATGIKINPANYSNREIKDVVSSFIKIITSKNFYGPEINMIEPEMNCTDIVIQTLTESSKLEDKKNTDQVLPFIFGKDSIYESMLSYEESVALGIFYIIDHFLCNEYIMYKLNMESGWKDKTYIIKELDTISSFLVKLMSEQGAKCVGIWEKDVCFYSPDGIDIQEAIKHKNQHGSLLYYFPLYNPKQLVTENCDMLILTSAAEIINCYMAPQMNAKIIVEGKGGIISPTANRTLESKERLVIPDILAGCGSSIAAYLQYTKKKEELAKRDIEKYIEASVYGSDIFYPESDEENVNANITDAAIKLRISSAIKRIMTIRQDYNLNLDIRTAAYIMITEKIFDLLDNHKSLRIV